RSDRRQIETIFDGHQLRIAVDLTILGRIQFEHVEVLVDRLRFDVGFRTDLRRYFIPRRARYDDAHGLFAPGFDAIGQFDFGRLASSKDERIKRRLDIEILFLLRELRNLGEQIAANFNLARRIFRQRNPDGVAEPVAKKRTDADGALDAAVLPFSGFGHT